MSYAEWLESLRVIREGKKKTGEQHDKHKELLDKERSLMRFYSENQDKFLQEQLDTGE